MSGGWFETVLCMQELWWENVHTRVIDKQKHTAHGEPVCAGEVRETCATDEEIKLIALHMLRWLL